MLILAYTTMVSAQTGIYHRTQTASKQSSQIQAIKGLLDLYSNDPFITADIKDQEEARLGREIWHGCPSLQKQVSDPMMLRYVNIFDLELFGDCNLYLTAIKNYLIRMIKMYGVRSKKALLGTPRISKGSE
jgi:hypothetical protein